MSGHSNNLPVNSVRKNYSEYSLVSSSDLTPGSLEIWVDLPDKIKYDPSLAPFKNLYEKQHGKLERSYSIDAERQLLTRRDSILESMGEVASSTVIVKEVEENEINNTHAATEDKQKQTSKQKKILQIVRIAKLSGLVACWLFLTVSLLLNREKEDQVLHTTISSSTAKEYQLPGDNGTARVLVTLTGPFDVANGDNSTDEAGYLHIWLQRRSGGDTTDKNSTTWPIKLVSDSEMDFSPSDTQSKVIELSVDTVYETAVIGPTVENRSKPGKVKRKVKMDDTKHVVMVKDNESSVSLMLHTSSRKSVPLTISYQMNPFSEREGIIYAALLLLGLYILIVFEIVNRTLAALLLSSLGVAVLAIGGARPTMPELMSWLDVETLLLLFSMMILVAILAETGLFDYLAILAFEKTGGKTWPLINTLCFFTAFFSTFLDNVTTVLLMTPVTIRLCEVMQLNPVPILMSMVIFSNVGGAATPVGDPPNVIIASNPPVVRAGINFTNFTLHMTLGILLVCVQTYLQIRFVYRDMNKLRHSVPQDIHELRQEIAVWRRAAESLSSYSKDEDVVRKALQKKVDKLTTALELRKAGGQPAAGCISGATLQQMKLKYRIRDAPLLIKSAVCVAFVVVVFFLHAIPMLQRLSLGWTALLGALLLLLLAEREDLEPILARVEWSTLLFFAALFVLMEALSKLGLIEWIGNLTESVIEKVSKESQLAVALLLILWVSGLASAFVDNIPLTTMMIRVTTALGEPSGLGLPLPPLVWALSFGACLGGNGTLIGASANVVCAGVAEQHGYRFTFLEFLKFGFPIMIGNLLVASLYLLLCHCVIGWNL